MNSDEFVVIMNKLNEVHLIGEVVKALLSIVEPVEEHCYYCEHCNGNKPYNE